MRFEKTILMGLLLCGLTLAMAAEAGPGASSGLELADLDRGANACVDFYHFADGGWLAKNPIPPAYPSWGTFNELQNRNQENLRRILESATRPDPIGASAHAPEGSEEQKIGDFYASCMDESQVEPEFKRIEAVHDIPSLEDEVARLHTQGVNALFRFHSTQDKKNSTQVIGGATQAGLGMPDRDYYTKTDEKSKTMREKYLAHVSKMLELLGDDPAKAAAEANTVMGIETKLAQASMTRVERRDPDKTYHKMDLAKLQALTPNFSWERFFHEVGFPEISAVDVGQPDFLAEVNRELASVPLGDW